MFGRRACEVVVPDDEVVRYLSARVDGEAATGLPEDTEVPSRELADKAAHVVPISPGR